MENNPMYESEKYRTYLKSIGLTIDDDKELERLWKEDDQLEKRLKKMLDGYKNFFDCEFDDKFLAVRKKRGIVINKIHAIYEKGKNNVKNDKKIDFK